MTEYMHAVTAIDFASRGVTGVRLGSRCGEPGPTASVASEATCPACLALVNVATIRAAVERVQSSIGSVVLDLSVCEGRGDWAALPADNRREAGVQGLEHLDAAIVALKAQQAELRSALGVTCRNCHRAFDPADARFDGHAEDRRTPGFCRSCVDRCHEGDSDHRCPICA